LARRLGTTPSQGLDEQGRALAGDPGQDESRDLVAAQGETLTQLLGGDVDAALLDRQRADVPLAQRRAELLLAVGELLDDAVAAGERRVERRLAAHVGDLPVDQMALDAGRDRGDEPCT